MAEDLQLSELVLTGGTWSGRLFDNPSIGLEPALTWTFRFTYADVVRGYGDTTPGLTVDWIPLMPPHWSLMAGQRAWAKKFAEPIEASFYFSDHFSYEKAEVFCIEQNDTKILVRAHIHEDLDDLGIPEVTATGWLDFDGIVVALSDEPPTVVAARDRLAAFIDPSGLVSAPSDGGYYLFTVTD